MRSILNVLLVLFALLPRTADFAQAAESPAPPADAGAAVQDPLGRTTPRGTVLGFLKAAQGENYRRAAEYLDSRYAPARTLQLARELKVVLDRELSAVAALLSARPDGDPYAAPKPNRQLIGHVATASASVEILLDRVQRDGSPPIWLFSWDTLHRISEVYADIRPPWVEPYLPAVVVTNRFLGFPLWVVAATLLSIPLAFGLARLLSRALIPVLRRLIRYITKEQADRQLERIVGPIRVLMLVVALHWTIRLFEVPFLVRQYWDGVALLLAVVALTWLFGRLIDILSELTHRHLERLNRPHSASMLGLLRRLGKLTVLAAGLLFLLYTAGVNITAVIAGLGVGGIAVALAAQKTLENLFGGITITSDEPVRVGDFCRFGDQTGTVEDVGLRSTRIRTPDRTLISVPNGHLSSISVENFGLRDKIWFHPTIQLRYETSADQLRYVLAEIRQMLYAHPKVESQSARIRFVKLGSSSLDLEVFAYVLTTDFGVFLEIQEDLLLRIMEIVEASGTRFAFPTQTAYVKRDPGLDADKTRTVLAEVRRWRDENALPFPNFPPEQIARVEDTIEYPPPDSALRRKSPF